MTMPQSRPMHEGSIPTSKTPKISFLCGLDKKSSKQAGLLDFSFLPLIFLARFSGQNRGESGQNRREKRVFRSISSYSNSPSASDLAFASLSLHLLAKSVASGNAIPLTIACAEESFDE